MSFVIETSYPWHPSLKQFETETRHAETVEEAAQIFESEAEPYRYPLSRIVEDLAAEGSVSYQDRETGRTIEVRQIERVGV